MTALRKTIGSALAFSILLAGASAAAASNIVSGSIQFTGRIVAPPLRMISSQIPALPIPSRTPSGAALELQPQDQTAVSVAVDLPGSGVAPATQARCEVPQRSAPVAMPANGCHFSERGGRILLRTPSGAASPSTVVRVSYD